MHNPHFRLHKSFFQMIFVYFTTGIPGNQPSVEFSSRFSFSSAFFTHVTLFAPFVLLIFTKVFVKKSLFHMA